MWSVEEMTSTRRSSSAFAAVEVAEELLEHRRVDRVAGVGPVELEQRDPVGVDVVAGQRLAHSSSSSSSPAARRSTRRSASSAASSNSAANLVAALAEAAEHVAGDDLGVGRVGAADADPDAPEVAAAEAALEALQPVVAGDAAAALGPHLAEGEVDLVVQGDDRSSGDAELAAGGAGGVCRTRS